MSCPPNGSSGPACRVVVASASAADLARFLDTALDGLERIGRVLPGAYCHHLSPESHEAARRVRVRAGDAWDGSAALALRVRGVGGTIEVTPVAGAEATGDRLAARCAGADALWFVAPFPPRGAADDPLQPLRALLRSWDVSASEPPRVIVTCVVAGRDGLPEPLARALGDDPFAAVYSDDQPAPVLAAFQPAAHRAALARVSEEVQEWVRRVDRNGGMLVSAARGFGFPLEFTLAVVAPAPAAGRRRALDPLWLTLDGSEAEDEGEAVPVARVESPPSFALILDGADAANGCAAWTLLTARGPTTTYVLGRVRPVSGPGAAPEVFPESAGAPPRLLGPILESLPDSTRALALSAGPILDADDFRETSWADRLVCAPRGVNVDLEALVARVAGPSP